MLSLGKVPTRAALVVAAILSFSRQSLPSEIA